MDQVLDVKDTYPYLQAQGNPGLSLPQLESILILDFPLTRITLDPD